MSTVASVVFESDPS